MNRYFIENGQHIGIPTDCFEQSVAFYERLGFVCVHHIDRTEGQVSFLQLGELVLEVYEQPVTARVDGAIDHIAMDCSDIEAAYHAMQEDGYTFLTDGIQHLPNFWSNGVKYFIVEGPNKERVELNQKL